MSEKQDQNQVIDVKQETEQQQKQEWYDSLITVVQEFLDFNMHTYKKENVPRL